MDKTLQATSQDRIDPPSRLLRPDRSPNRGNRSNSGIRLGRIRDIDIVAGWSLLIIFSIIALSLAMGVFPAWHPDWHPAFRWLMGILAAILFFASVLAHALTHALVARLFSVPVDRITLFPFGGLAEMRQEPPRPRAEFFIAASGPVASFLIGGLATFLGLALATPTLNQLSVAVDPKTFAAALSPTATLLLWLGPINLLLAVFNLIPGFRLRARPR